MSIDRLYAVCVELNSLSVGSCGINPPRRRIAHCCSVVRLRFRRYSRRGLTDWGDRSNLSLCLRTYVFLLTSSIFLAHSRIISRLHDQALSTSYYMLAGRASSMFAWWLIGVCYALYACFIFARRLLDVCSMFARSRKRGIRFHGLKTTISQRFHNNIYIVNSVSPFWLYRPLYPPGLRRPCMLNSDLDICANNTFET